MQIVIVTVKFVLYTDESKSFMVIVRSVGRNLANDYRYVLWFIDWNRPIIIAVTGLQESNIANYLYLLTLWVE